MTLRVKRVKWDPEPALQAARDGGKDGMQAASRYILDLANQHAPLNTGRLIGSSKVDYNDDAATVYYDTPYAARTHQNRRMRFRNGRQAGWLRTAAVKSKPGVLEFLGDRLRLRFRRA